MFRVFRSRKIDLIPTLLRCVSRRDPIVGFEERQITNPYWTQVLSALLVPTIALFACYIAWRQWRTAQNKLKLDLFEKRFAVYDTARNLFDSVVTSGKAEDKEM